MATKTNPPTFGSLDELQTLFVTIERTASDAILNNENHAKDAALWMIEKLSNVAAGDIDNLLREAKRILDKPHGECLEAQLPN